MTKDANPTARLTVEVPTEGTDHPYWAWCEYGDIPAMDEYVYAPGELCRAMTVYGRVVAGMLSGKAHTRFRLVAHGLRTGRAVGMSEWAWDMRTGLYEPTGHPWITCPPKGELAPGATWSAVCCPLGAATLTAWTR